MVGKHAVLCLVIMLSALVPATAPGALPAVEGGPAPLLDGASSWAASEIETVVAAGLLGPDVATFRPDDLLTRGELDGALLALGRATPVSGKPDRVVTIGELDARLVGALGAFPAARAIRLAAEAAGLEPKAMLGTETVARLLGLRHNHPVGSEHLERSQREPATRAEAAFSLARALAVRPETVASLTAKATALSFPELTDPQREVLARALRLVGSPYVFAGTSESPQLLWDADAPDGRVAVPGGFDCSGFVWRVYKLEPLLTAPAVGDVLRGRTSYAMSGEVASAQRIPLSAAEPGDVLFFGSAGPRSRPSQVGHMGLSIGGGWFVHASRAGVTLQPLEGWHARSFAWARRPLAELAVAA
jgi:cell wall-associated NlpC family hydrolase